jgi:hypothetical protein
LAVRYGLRYRVRYFVRYLARSAADVRSITSRGVAAIVFASSSKYSPGAGSNSDCDFLISARKSGSRVVAWNA